MSMNEQQWQWFSEFCQWELAVGGPDPHMRLIVQMSQAVELPERAWRAACYAGVYNVPTAEAIWRAWPWAQAAELSRTAWATWLHQHWAGIATRRERRSVRNAEKLAQYLYEVARWLPRRQANAPYDALWQDVHGIYSVGRYAAMKLLEALRRLGCVKAAMPDLRPTGGDSPREALALIFPHDTGRLMGEDNLANNALANERAMLAKERLRACGLQADEYLIQVLLCDYKQSYLGQRQYPGRSHDSELAYYQHVSAHFGPETDMFAARRTLYPEEALGECQGWNGVRKALGHTLRAHEYTWSDLLYDYQATMSLAQPVRRQPPASARYPAGTVVSAGHRVPHGPGG